MTYRPELRAFSLTLIAYLVGQMLLHLIYGDEPFLYSAHFMPAMIMVGAIGFLCPARVVTRGVALLFIITAAISNYANLQDALYRVYAGLHLSAPIKLAKSDLGFVNREHTCHVSRLTVTASGTSYQGPPVFKLIVDGKEIGEGIVYNARDNSERPVEPEEVYRTMEPQAFRYDSAERPKEIEVRFTNDQSSKGKTGDRNLFVKEIWVDSQQYMADLLEIGTEGLRLRNDAMIGLFRNGSVILRPHATLGCI